MEERVLPEAGIMLANDESKEYRIGFRIYCDNGDEEDKENKRYNGWAPD